MAPRGLVVDWLAQYSAVGLRRAELAERIWAKIPTLLHLAEDGDTKLGAGAEDRSARADRDRAARAELLAILRIETVRIDKFKLAALGAAVVVADRGKNSVLVLESEEVSDGIDDVV